MRKIIYILAPMAVIASLLWTAISFAQGSVSATMTVSARVLESVTLSVTPMDFGNLNSEEPTTAIGNITVETETGSAYAIAIDGGMAPSGSSRGMSGENGGVVLYEIRKEDGTLWGDAGYGNSYPDGTPLTYIGSESSRTHTVYGTIPVGQQLPEVGSYNDMVTVTVVY